MEPYWEQDGNKIYLGDALEVLKSMPGECVQICVTSPPYWGLRDYDLPPMIWDSEPPDICEGGRDHIWGDEKIVKRGHPGELSTLVGTQTAGLSKSANSQGQFCQICGAWRGCLGLEPTPELYIQHMVQIFCEVKRVLRNDGTFWLNMGDSYCADSHTRKSGKDAFQRKGDNGYKSLPRY